MKVFQGVKNCAGQSELCKEEPESISEEIKEEEVVTQESAEFEPFVEIKEDVFVFNDEGDVLEGILVNKMPGDDNISTRYYVDVGECVRMIWGTAILDNRLSSANIGDKIRITFNGTKSIGKNKTLHLFKVEIAKPKPKKEGE